MRFRRFIIALDAERDLEQRWLDPTRDDGLRSIVWNLITETSVALLNDGVHALCSEGTRTPS
jgi:hypothetical protein